MSLLDVLLALIVISSVIAGFSAGLARVGIGFLAAIAGVIFGFWFYRIPAAWVHGFIGSVAFSNVIGFLLVFWAILVAGALIAKLISTIFKWTGFSWLDRLLGGAFGVVRGALISVGFVAILLAFIPHPLPAWMVNSKLLPYAVDASNLIASAAPADLKEAVSDGLQEIRKDWDEELKKSRRKKSPEELPLKQDNKVI